MHSGLIFPAITDDLLIMGNDAYNSRIFIGSNNNLKMETNTNGQEFALFDKFLNRNMVLSGIDPNRQYSEILPQW